MGEWLSAHWGAIVAALGTGGGGIGIGRIYGRYLDHRRDQRRQTDEVAMGLVKLLETRVASLEAAMDHERAKCDAELNVHRHRINNQRSIIYSLLHLFEVPATRRKPMLDSVRAQLQALEHAEAVEKGMIAAAPLKLVDPAE